MAKLTTITVPCEGTTREMTGTVAILPIGGRKTRFLIERRVDGSIGALTHYASGYAFHRNLRALAVSYLVRHSVYHRQPSARELAKAVIADAVDNIGVEQVLATIDAAPVINP